MEKLEICINCNKNIGKHACNNCGSLVCDYCFSRKRGLCSRCIVKIK